MNSGKRFTSGSGRWSPDSALRPVLPKFRDIRGIRAAGSSFHIE